MNKFFRLIAVTSALLIGSSIGYSANAAQVKVTPVSAQSDIIPIAFEEPETVLKVGEKLPSSYSSKDLGYQTPVRNQGITNICWSFAAMASLETKLVKDEKIAPVSSSWFSVSHLDAWGTQRKDGSGWVRTYQRGNGYPYIPMGYLSSWSGAISEYDFPFLSPLSSFDETKKEDIQYGITGIMYIEGNDRNTVKKAIQEYGAVTTSYNSHSSFTKDVTSTYCPSKTNSLSGHNVSVIGWDDNYSKDNFLTAPPEDGAWLCKNSWGENNEYGGYIWISYYDYYVFSDVFGPSYCFTDYTTVAEYNNIYQNEVFGATYEFSYADDILYKYPANNPSATEPYTLGSKNNVYINVLDFDKEDEYLDTIVFESTSIGAKYTLYYIPVNADGTPTSQANLWQEIGSGTVNYSGYINNDIDNFKIPKGKAGIGVRIDTTGVKNPDIKNGIGVSEWLSSGTGRIFNSGAKRGDSFIQYKDEDNVTKLTDVMDFYNKYCGDDEGGTFVIKSISTKESNIIGDANLDGKLNISDATVVQKYSIHLVDLDGQGLQNADFNNDGKVNIKDCTAIQKAIVKAE